MQPGIAGKNPATRETLGDRAARDPAVARVFARFAAPERTDDSPAP
ncbi:MAG TPA: hypothetical protein VE954_24955 [Oligoflexus sp.]|nr:hypothetical protein [Oligoflexus sp.]HYX36368.1 hypothetical protein [Oligoflexus sp.]